MTQYVASAMFDSEPEAQAAVRDLRDAGLSSGAISLIAQSDGRMMTTTASGETTDEGDSDEGNGSVARGVLGGGALGAGLAVAALAIPGVGPLVAAGAIAATATPAAIATGAVLGAVAGGVGEGLRERGVSHEDADYFDNGMSSGGTIVAVDDTAMEISASEVREILYRNGGHSSTQSRLVASH